LFDRYFYALFLHWCPEVFFCFQNVDLFRHAFYFIYVYVRFDDNFITFWCIVSIDRGPRNQRRT
jgi:hypothetical protein